MIKRILDKEHQIYVALKRKNVFNNLIYDIIRRKNKNGK